MTLLLSSWVLGSCGDDDGSPSAPISEAPTPSFPAPGSQLPGYQPPPSGGSGTTVPPGGSYLDEPADDWPGDEWPTDDDSSLPPDDTLSIQGKPSTSVLYDVEYEFTPSVDNADGEALSFSVTNLPVWAEFDPQTGRLSGKPTVEHIGMYTDVTISVSDGQQTASLPSFTIDVVAMASGSIALSWNPPTQRSDGTPLADLAGYKLYWGTKKDDYTSSTTIDNPSVTRYVIENLTPATYYVVATAYDAAGIESTFSNVGRAVIR